MSRIIDSTQINIEKSESILGFETTGEGNWKVWDRFLTIDDKKAYHIGNVCGTCSFFFERLEGANRSISPEEVVGLLNNGLEIIDKDTIDKISSIMPNGNYIINLIEISPKLVSIGMEDDYFSKEQAEELGIDSFWGFPHHPKVRYYRGDTRSLGDSRMLYEFFVPMFPQNWLNNDKVIEYKRNLLKGQKPTAISITILDIKEHHDGTKAHWCLTHYIVDGHHKVFAANETNKEISLLSFLAVDQGISDSEEIELLVDKLKSFRDDCV